MNEYSSNLDIVGEALYKTVVVSDLHLGIKASKVRQVVRFLKHHPSERIILNGDIIDGWQLRKSGKWKKKHSLFFKMVMKLAHDRNREIIYLRGNHDDFLDEILPFHMGSFSIVRDYELTGLNGKKYYVVHGDIFDSVTTNLKFLAKLGDVGYTFLLWLNRIYNNYRIKRGLPYYSLSQKIKAKVKTAVSFISDFETELSEVARIKHCQGVITGHIHQPADKMINGIHYLNSGDWVETMSALVEDYEGNWKVVYFEEWLLQFEANRLKEANIVSPLANATTFSPSKAAFTLVPKEDGAIPGGTLAGAN
ncbi:MAG: UDP-2,3-diacylglucosamine diphosphatase [Bacteroidota bacterium]|nr:UDP-2,3-diacylglucosamine diphosphatase [Bacteroidota bacterium]